MGLGLIIVGALALKELSKINTENITSGFRPSSCHGHNSLHYSYRNWSSTHVGGVWTGAYFQKKYILFQVSINLW